MDALAITLGSNGAAVGIAPMGTALTVNQIKLLRANIDMVNGRDRIAVATDSDPAGWKSAQKAFWHLTAADLDPTHLELPDGLDPAKLFETQGAAAITAAIENRAPLGDAMIDHLLRTAGHWSDTDVRQKLIHQTARSPRRPAARRSGSTPPPGSATGSTSPPASSSTRPSPRAWSATATARPTPRPASTRSTTKPASRHPRAIRRPVAGPPSSGSPPRPQLPDPTTLCRRRDPIRPARHDDSASALSRCGPDWQGQGVKD